MEALVFDFFDLRGENFNAFHLTLGVRPLQQAHHPPYDRTLATPPSPFPTRERLREESLCVHQGHDAAKSI